VTKVPRRARCVRFHARTRRARPTDTAVNLSGAAHHLGVYQSRPPDTVTITAAGPLAKSDHPLNKAALPLPVCSAARRSRSGKSHPHRHLLSSRPFVCSTTRQVFRPTADLSRHRIEESMPTPSLGPPAGLSSTPQGRRQHGRVGSPSSNPSTIPKREQRNIKKQEHARALPPRPTRAAPRRGRCGSGGLNLFHYNRSPIGGPPDISRQPERMIVQVLTVR
jgi:hypothetical protein